jgi:hypothetical protein
MPQVEPRAPLTRRAYSVGGLLNLAAELVSRVAVWLVPYEGTFHVVPWEEPELFSPASIICSQSLMHEAARVRS